MVMEHFLRWNYSDLFSEDIRNQSKELLTLFKNLDLKIPHDIVANHYYLKMTSHSWSTMVIPGMQDIISGWTLILFIINQIKKEKLYDHLVTRNVFS